MKLNYVEMPLIQFARIYPDIAKNVPCLELLLTDVNYIVRWYDGKLEIGYAGDKWEIE